MSIPTFLVVATWEDDNGDEIEWRGEFTETSIEHLFSDFSSGCEASTFEVWENGEQVYEQD